MKRFTGRVAVWTAAALAGAGTLAVGLATLAGTDPGARQHGAPGAQEAASAAPQRPGISASRSRVSSEAPAARAQQQRQAESKVIELLAGRFDPLTGKLPAQQGSRCAAR